MSMIDPFEMHRLLRDSALAMSQSLTMPMACDCELFVARKAISSDEKCPCVTIEVKIGLSSVIFDVFFYVNYYLRHFLLHFSFALEKN